MDIGIFHDLLLQLDRPEILRLNYSGESIHHPHLGEAVEAAKATGATVELVSAFASASDSVVLDLVDKGLDRLTVSLHATDEAEYRRIYGFSSFSALKHKIKLLRVHQAATHRWRPELTFAFVAMDANLNQLEEVARFAGECGAGELSIHPVIRRDPILIRFPSELDPRGALLPDFEQRLHLAVGQVRCNNPALRIEIARPESPRAPHHGMRAGPVTCEQNPWETVHVLANGDIVPCEVQDKTTLGNLSRERLKDIWHGPAYSSFRDRYRSGTLAPCETCPWEKRVPEPDCLPAVGSSAGITPQFTLGWHPAHHESVIWSRRRAALTLAHPSGTALVRIRGLLTPAARGGGNVLTVSSCGYILGRVSNTTSGIRAFDVQWPWKQRVRKSVALEFETSTTFSPVSVGMSGDSRELGFALIEAAVRQSTFSPLRTFFRSLAVLDAITERAAPLYRGRRLRGNAGSFRAGVSVIIPERGNAELLAECLRALAVAASPVHEPVQVIVIVNGSPIEDYRRLRQLYNGVSFQFWQRPLGFSRAIQCGLESVRHDWVYLLNNDMELHPGALTPLFSLRAPDVFSIGSQIFMSDPDERRVETNFNEMEIRDGLVEVRDGDPPAGNGAVDSLYAGGGCSLFRTKLLKRLVRSAGSVYDPFYFEDVEWGAVALRLGYKNLFCPASLVRHHRRATVGKFYEPEEVERIFGRNRLLFQLRNLRNQDGLDAVYQQLRSGDPRTVEEMLVPCRVAAILAARFRSGLASMAPIASQN